MKSLLIGICMLLAVASLISCGGGGGGGGVVTIPAAPTVAVTKGVKLGDPQISLSWNLVPGATDYNIYFSTSPNAQTSGNKIYSITPASTATSPLTFNDNGLAASTLYYYAVTAVNSVGESASPDTTVTTLLAGQLNLFAGNTINSFGKNDASVGTNATFGSTPIRQIATDSVGNVYMADIANNTIRMVTPSGAVSTLGSNLGPFLFNSPQGVATDTDATGAVIVYVANTNNHTIDMIANGVLTTLAGSGTAGYANGIGAAASFSSPSAIATDGKGNLYVTELINYTVRKIVIASGVVTTLAGPDPATCAAAPFGTCPSGGVNDLGNVARFNGLRGIASDSAGNVYVTDQEPNNSFNGTVRKITATGNVSTLAGTIGGTAGNTDATGPKASFTAPVGITTDRTSNIYVAGNNLIRKITPTGVVTTVVGTATQTTFAGGNLPGQLAGATGVAVSGAKISGANLYIMMRSGIAKVDNRP